MVALVFGVAVDIRIVAGKALLQNGARKCSEHIDADFLRFLHGDGPVALSHLTGLQVVGLDRDRIAVALCIFNHTLHILDIIYDPHDGGAAIELFAVFQNLTLDGIACIPFVCACDLAEVTGHIGPHLIEALGAFDLCTFILSAKCQNVSLNRLIGFLVGDQKADRVDLQIDNDIAGRGKRADLTDPVIKRIASRSEQFMERMIYA